MNPTVSIVIVTYNSAEHLSACLESIADLHYDPAPQLVVVDNASADESIAVTRRLAPAALLLPQEANLGFGGAVNLGVGAADGDIVVLLNPDTRVRRDWLSQLVAALAEPACGIAGSKILDPDGRTLRHTGGLVNRATLLTNHRGDGEIDRGQYDATQAVPFVTGAAMALRRAVWERLGGMDVGFYPAYFEDLDLCWRVQRLGLECRYVPQSTLLHVESTSTGKYSGVFYYYYHRNRLRFACKHLPWLELWNSFCPAEGARLSTAPLLDRRVAELVYRQSFARGLALPDQAEQAQILATGRALAELRDNQQQAPEAWPASVQELLGIAPAFQSRLAGLLAETQQEAVLREHEFRSALPFVAALRRAWNSIATRWYLLPVLHQQTRANLATSRALELLAQQNEADPVRLTALVCQAALCFRVAQLETVLERAS